MMAREVAAAERTMPLRAAAELMLEREQPLLPVLDERGVVVGVLSAGDLVRRAGLALPLRLFSALTADERRAVLDLLAPGDVAEVLTADPRTVTVETPIPLAISPMVEWGIDLLPVLDHAGRLAGLFGVEHALRAALRNPGGHARRHGKQRSQAPRRMSQRAYGAEPPTPVSLVMQRAVPSIAAETPLLDALARAAGRARSLPGGAGAGRPVGTLTDLHLARTLDEPMRSIWLAALRSPEMPLPQALEGAAGQTAGELGRPGAAQHRHTGDLRSATQLMIAGGHERLVVLDEEGRLAGLLARRGLLRALAQASAAECCRAGAPDRISEYFAPLQVTASRPR